MGIFRGKRGFKLWIIMLLLLSAACSNQSNDHKDASQGVMLDFMVTTENLSDRLRKVIENYEAATGNKVEIQSFPSTEYNNILKTKMMSDDGPDLFVTDDIAMAQFANPRTWFTDLSSEEWVTRLSPGGKQMITWNDGQITGLPITNPGGFGLMYNKDIFEEVGITELPTTWEQFLDICETLKKAGYIPINIQLANGSEFGTTHLMHQLFANVEFTRQDNIQAFYEGLNTNQIKLADVSEYQQALEQMVELKEKGYTNDDFMSTSFDMTQERFGSGKVAMHPCGDFVLPPMLANYPDLRVGFLPAPFNDTPGAAALYAGVGISVNAKADQKAAALEFISFFASKAQQEQFMSTAPGTNVFADVKAEHNMISQDLQVYIDQGRAFMLLAGKMEPWPEMEARKAMQEMMLGSKTPLQFLKEMDQKASIIAKGKKLEGW